jgi:hypothetical protein
VQAVKRLLVRALAEADAAIDEVLYRPAIVKAFGWLPRWWLCDLAKLSVWLDDRWDTQHWGNEGAPGAPCTACGRRASWLEISGLHADDPPIGLCGWCDVAGPIKTEDDLQRELGAARDASVSWRWRWPARNA